MTRFGRNRRTRRRAFAAFLAGGAVAVATLSAGPSTARATVTGAFTVATQQQTAGKSLYVGGDGRAQDFDIYVENVAGDALVGPRASTSRRTDRRTAGGSCSGGATATRSTS